MRNSGKWVCVRSPSTCSGYFIRNGRRMICPLMSYCAAEKIIGRKWEYEFHSTVSHNVLLELGTYPPGHDYERSRRKREYIKLFAPELDAEFRKKECLRVQKYYRENKERISAKKKLAYAAEHQPQPPAQRPMLPCGEDCENCPYDACHYPDKDGDVLYDEYVSEIAREKANAKARKYRKEHPDKHAAAARRYRATHKEHHREKQREYNARWRAKWTEEQREAAREKDRLYRAKHREEINARQRERRKKAKELP